MKNGFIPTTIGSICRLVNGRAFKPSDWSNEGLPIVRIQNLNDKEKPFNYYTGVADDKHLIDDGDVLLSWSGTSQSMVKISGSSLRAIEVPVPGSKDEQERTLAGLRNRHARAKAIQGSVAEIPVNHLRHSILRKAFAGEQ